MRVESKQSKKGNLMDIVIGNTRIYYIQTNRTKGWVVHGGFIITDYDVALAYAHKVHKLIQGSTS